MKRIILLVLVPAFFLSGCETTQAILDGLPGSTNPTSQEIASGLKEALTIGAQNSTGRLSAVDGFFSNAAIKILMPQEARKVESTLRSLGMGSLVDKAIKSMNQGAEEASKSALPIFRNAILRMSIMDAAGILKGGDFAATNYFREKTTTELSTAFRPVIESSLKKVDATKYWEDVFTAYNKFAKNPVNTDLSAYVTERAISGIFHELALEEQKIRKDPAARVTELLKKVFGTNQGQ